MRDQPRIGLMLTPALLVIVGLFMTGLVFGVARSLNYMPIIGLDEPNFNAYYSIFTSTEFLRSLALTLYIAVASTAISIVLAVGSAIVLRHRFKGKKIATFFYQLNLPIPHIVGALGILELMSQSGLFARVAHALHLIDAPSDFPTLVHDSFALGIIAEYAWKETIFIGVVALAIFQSVGEDYEEQARTLGANPWQRFRYVLLPLVMPGVLSSSVIVLAFTLGSYEIPYILGESYPSPLPVLAVRSYTSVDLSSRPEAMAMAIVIACISTVLILVYMWLSRRYVRSEAAA